MLIAVNKKRKKKLHKKLQILPYEVRVKKPDPKTTASCSFSGMDRDSYNEAVEG
jgi:hypothetical protein